MVRWSFSESPETGKREPLGITAFDREDVDAVDDSGAGLPPIGVRAFSGRDTLLEVDEHKVRLRREGDPAGTVIAEVDIDPLDPFLCEVLPTRSGKHLLAIHRGKRFVLSTSDLQTVRELAPTPGLADYDQRFRGIENHVCILTDDLRYLIKVPFNAGEPQGWNHCKAVVYDLEHDATHEVTLELGGEGWTSIEDAESESGELRFLARREDKVVIVDSHSTVLATLPMELFGSGSWADRLYWDPLRKHYATWGHVDPMSLDINELVVTDYDYGTNEAVTYKLDWGDAVAVLQAR